MPRLDALLQRLVRVDQLGARFVRGVPGHHEGDLVALADGELRMGGEVLAVGVHFGVAAEPHGVGSGDRHPGAVDAPHPGHHAPVVEAHPQPAVHLHPAGDPLDDPYHVGPLVPLRHEVDHLDGAGRGLPDRLQDQGVVEVAAVGAGGVAARGDLPVTVVRAAEQRGEAGGRVEARQAQPVDGTVRADQRRGLQVADHGVVLDASCHAAAFLGTGVRPRLRDRSGCAATARCPPPRPGRRRWARRSVCHRSRRRRTWPAGRPGRGVRAVPG